MLASRSLRRLLAALSILVLLTLGTTAYAVVSNDPLTGVDRLLTGVESGAGLDHKVAEPQFIVANLVQVALSLVGIVLIILIIYGGYRWGTARGNESQVDDARGLIRDAIIGLIVIFAAFFITTFVVRVIGNAVFDPNFYNTPR